MIKANVAPGEKNRIFVMREPLLCVIVVNKVSQHPNPTGNSSGGKNERISQAVSHQ
jgi:hypothetical protein